MNKFLQQNYGKSIKLIALLLLLNPAVSYPKDVWDKWDSHSMEYQDNTNADEYQWQEGGNVLPPYPEQDDLVEVSAPPAYKNYQYFIDSKNLLVGDDGVVRYSIIIRSKSGADNALYEAIRCNRNTIKHYAYGSTNDAGEKVFTARSSVEWQAFQTTGVMSYGDILVKNYFCNHSGAVLKRHEIIQNLKYGKGTVDGFYN